MRSIFELVVSLALLVIGQSSGVAAPIKINFEGLCDNAVIGTYYTGGVAGTCAVSGPKVGVQFSDAVARLESKLGGSGLFNGEPSPPTAAFTSGIMTINVPAGFVSSLTLSYSNPYSTTTIRVFDQLELRGNTLAEENWSPIPQPVPNVFGPFASMTLTFDGVAHSIAITSRGPNGVYIDDLLISPTEVTEVPEPTEVWPAALVLGIWFCAHTKTRPWWPRTSRA